jgi:hypothetical protein
MFLFHVDRLQKKILLAPGAAPTLDLHAAQALQSLVWSSAFPATQFKTR